MGFSGYIQAFGQCYSDNFAINLKNDTVLGLLGGGVAGFTGGEILGGVGGIPGAAAGGAIGGAGAAMSSPLKTGVTCLLPGKP